MMETLNFEQMEQVNGSRMSIRDALCGGSLMTSIMSVGIAASSTGVGAAIGCGLILFSLGMHVAVC